MIEFHLQKDGFRTATLSNPLEAIGTARDFCPDLIILDVMMPELDGLRLCSMLKVDSKLKDVPILFLTAKCEPDERVKGFERGADDYLTKPFDNRELVARTEGQFLPGPLSASWPYQENWRQVQSSWILKVTRLWCRANW